MGMHRSCGVMCVGRRFACICKVTLTIHLYTCCMLLYAHKNDHMFVHTLIYVCVCDCVSLCV